MRFHSLDSDGLESRQECPILLCLVFKYAREVFEIRGWQGTRSTILIPASSSWLTLSGLLESSRIRVAPRAFRILAGSRNHARRRRTQGFVRLNGIHATILQLIRAQLIHEPDPPAFLRQIEQNTGRPSLVIFSGKLQLCPAIAAQGGQHVSGQALRVHAHKGSVRPRTFPRTSATASSCGALPSKP